MPKVTKQDLEQQNAQLSEINRRLTQDIPNKIIESIRQSEEFKEFIAIVDSKKSEIETANNNIQEQTQQHLQALEEKNNEHLSTLEEEVKKFIAIVDSKKSEIETEVNNIQEQMQQHLQTLDGKKNEHLSTLEGKIEESKNIHETQIAELKETETEIKSNIVSEIKRFEDLKEKFETLTSHGFNSKSSELIVADYKENAKMHQGREDFFQKTCGLAIIVAIVILLIWLYSVSFGLITATTEYDWLPIATITSLLLFMSRWAARIAYRHGLEARRLNQYALDLTAMPAFFAQELLNQGDENFQAEGKKIIQAKSSKMFGNIERFDEQDLHGPMELVWKWLTKRFETTEEVDVPTKSDTKKEDTS